MQLKSRLVEGIGAIAAAMLLFLAPLLPAGVMIPAWAVVKGVERALGKEVQRFDVGEAVLCVGSQRIPKFPLKLVWETLSGEQWLEFKCQLTSATFATKSSLCVRFKGSTQEVVFSSNDGTFSEFVLSCTHSLKSISQVFEMFRLKSRNGPGTKSKKVTCG